MSLVFNFIDDTDITILKQEKYLYHFINRGQPSSPMTVGQHTFDLKGWIDTHHLKEAVVSGESFDVAKNNLLASDENIDNDYNYIFDVYLVAVDLKPHRVNPVLIVEDQSPIG